MRVQYVDLDAFVSTVGAAGSVAPTPPEGPYDPGTEVGVPTGTVLTPTAGLPAPDATEEITLTHPITGEQNTLTVSVYRHRSWAETLQFATDPGEHILFDECLFDRTSGDPFYCVDVVDTQLANNIMAPIAIFRRCTFDGNGNTGATLSGTASWIMDCHLDGANADAFFGSSYSVAEHSNFLCATGEPEAHLDAIQCPNVGQMVVYNCWCDVGPSINEQTNAAVRAATDFGSLVNVNVYYCGLSGGGYTLQLRGGGGNTVTGVHVVGNRWTEDSRFGPVDIDEFVTIDTWTDNAFFNGTPIPEPVVP